MKNFTMKITDVNSTWSVVLRERDADPTDSVNIRIVENGLATSVGKWYVYITRLSDQGFLIFINLSFSTPWATSENGKSVECFCLT